MATGRRIIFGRLTRGSERNLLDTLRGERLGGALLIAGALTGLILANGPTRSWFIDLAHSTLTVGPVALDIAHWTSEGLLTIFFFVVGLELTREIQTGQLRHARTAVVPVVGALGGMVVPAAIYLMVNLLLPEGDAGGWAIPTATDIAFAVAVLGLVATGLPLAVRAFLLTLAVVDDLLAIMVIAVFFSDGIAWAWLGAAVLGVSVFAWLLRTRAAHRRSPRLTLLLVAVAVLTWVSTLFAGVHATLAGVALGLVVPAVAGTRGDSDGRGSPAERYEHLWRPVAAGIAVPLFAVFAAGVVIDVSLMGTAIVDPVAVGVVLGLVVGKPLGITGFTWLLCRFTGARLAPGVSWAAIASVSCLAGIGFTVSLLIGSLVFGDTARSAEVVIAVLAASTVSAILGALALRRVTHAPAADAPRGGAT